MDVIFTAINAGFQERKEAMGEAYHDLYSIELPPNPAERTAFPNEREVENKFREDNQTAMERTLRSAGGSGGGGGEGLSTATGRTIKYRNNKLGGWEKEVLLRTSPSARVGTRPMDWGILSKDAM